MFNPFNLAGKAAGTVVRGIVKVPTVVKENIVDPAIQGAKEGFKGQQSIHINIDHIEPNK